MITLALGIGANAAIFSVVRGVLGVVLAPPFVAVVAHYAARFSVRALEVTVDTSVLWVGAGLAMAAAVLLAYVPRLPSPHSPAGLGLASGSIRITPGTNRRLRAFASLCRERPDAWCAARAGRGNSAHQCSRRRVADASRPRLARGRGASVAVGVTLSSMEPPSWTRRHPRTKSSCHSQWPRLMLVCTKPRATKATTAWRIR